MKRLLLGGLLLGGVAVLSGCPIFPDNNTYRCDDNGGCCSDNDCGGGETCQPGGQCTPNPPEEDASTGSVCGFCPPGTVCTLRDGFPQCSSPGTTDDGGVSFEDASAWPDASEGDGGLTSGDSGPDGGSEAGVPRVACNADVTCTGAGSKCIDGFCTPRSQLCSDTTQCKVAGESCVDGVCTPTCNSAQATPCPTGYQCDFTRGVCSVNPTACTASEECQGGAVCVESRCVAPATGDGGTCPAGQVAVNGGCIPDQAATFACTNIGNQGALASTCEANGVCLHGDCYVSCNGDGGTCGPDEFCKAVTTEVGGASNVYFVCAGQTNLGSECDPALGLACSPGLVCVDGYCK